MKGKTIVKDIALQGTNIIGFGEMGIGNTSSSSIIMSYICNYPIKDCIKETGINDKQLKNKIKILEESKCFHGGLNDIEFLLHLEAMKWFRCVVLYRSI